MLTVEGLRMTYRTDRGAVAAVNGVSFTVDPGEFFTLVGPSGCGKTTTLRCVAGLETPTSGRIEIGAQVAFDSAQRMNVSTPRRPIGMVFQSYAIWPHMTVHENVAFGLRYGRAGVPGAEIRERVSRALSLVHLEHLANRPAPLLSGGQQQRVALARALATEPQLLLLDEPLSNLDAKLREEMRQELKELVKRLHITTLYVTHDQVEALSMSDRVAVMADGLILQAGTPGAVYLTPNSEFTANFLGRANVLPGTIVAGGADAGFGRVATPCGTLACRLPEASKEGQEVLVVFRPEAVAIHTEAGKAVNAVPAAVRSASFTGEVVEYVMEAGGEMLRAKGDPFSSFPEGAQVWLGLPPERCLVIQRDAGAPARSAAPGERR